MFISKISPQTSSWANEPENSIPAKLLLDLMDNESANKRVRSYGGDGLHMMKPVEEIKLLENKYTLTVADEPLYTRTEIIKEETSLVLQVFQEEPSPMEELLELLGNPLNNRRQITTLLKSVKTSTVVTFTVPKYMGFFSNQESIRFATSKNLSVVTTLKVEKNDFKKIIELQKNTLNTFKIQSQSWVN
jgi:hypothetical protein